MFIAFWKCTLAPAWSAMAFAERVRIFKAAVGMAAVERISKVGRVGTWLFAAPEYAFSNPDRGRAKAAEQVDRVDERTLVKALVDLTTERDGLLPIPGTIVVRESNGPQWYTARNTSHAFFAGRPVWKFSKIGNIGETTPQEAASRELTFAAGLGHGSGNVGGTTFGGEICRDATGAGTLPGAVQCHVILGQGVGHGLIANKATELQIVADFNAHGVYDYRAGRNGREIRSYDKGTIHGTELFYYHAR